jgi:hypothetical protein
VWAKADAQCRQCSWSCACYLRCCSDDQAEGLGMLAPCEAPFVGVVSSMETPSPHRLKNAEMPGSQECCDSNCESWTDGVRGMTSPSLHRRKNVETPGLFEYREHSLFRLLFSPNSRNTCRRMPVNQPIKATLHRTHLLQLVAGPIRQRTPNCPVNNRQSRSRDNCDSSNVFNCEPRVRAC